MWQVPVVRHVVVRVFRVEWCVLIPVKLQLVLQAASMQPHHNQQTER